MAQTLPQRKLELSIIFDPIHRLSSNMTQNDRVPNAKSMHAKNVPPRACIMHKCMHLYAFLTIYGMHLIESILHIILYLSIALYASGLPRMHTSNICMHLYMHTCIRLHAHACILKNKLFVLWAYGVSFSTAKEFWDNAFYFMKQNKVMHA